VHDVGPAAGLVRLSFLVQSLYAEAGRDHGLTTPQAQLLCVLQDGPVGMAEISSVVRLERSSLTGLVDRAEQRGLVERRPDPADRRAVKVGLTPAGRRTVDGFHSQVTEALCGTLSGLSDSERERFGRTLRKLTADVPAVFGEP
jgi:DNA-binding MarR family transcriptional regulator